MMNQNCVFCKVVKLIASIGALNWGLVAFLNFNLVERLLGAGSAASRAAYGVVGLAGALGLIGLFVCCKACKKP